MRPLMNTLQAEFRKHRGQRRTDSLLKLSEAPAEIGLQNYFQAQEAIRPYFGKGESVEPKIGDHPDFAHLKQSFGTERHYAVTLFMDIESSTRLGLLYELEDTRDIKNAIIRMALEIISALDGHAHRIMGDAVMAFFGGKKIEAEQACIDALNAASLLSLFAQEVVIPAIESDGYAGNFGIRIGLEYGMEVLWASYGYPNMDEVTATAFEVDVAAKLQQLAGRNKIMIGQAIRNFLDLPEPLLAVKTETRTGVAYNVPFVRPNHTDSKGDPINYCCWEFDWEKYLGWTKLAQTISGVGTSSPVPVKIQVDGQPYLPCSEALAKWKSLEFKFTFPLVTDQDYRVELRRRNHGAEATAAHAKNRKGELFWKKSKYVRKGDTVLIHSDCTAYRGLHYLEAKAFIRDKFRHHVRVGVFVK